jgi:hypothetical protein
MAEYEQLDMLIGRAYVHAMPMHRTHVSPSPTPAYPPCVCAPLLCPPVTESLPLGTLLVLGILMLAYVVRRWADYVCRSQYPDQQVASKYREFGSIQ